MDSQKVYKSIVELLYNTIKNDRLKYWIVRDLKFREMAILLVNDLITLEKEHNATYKDEQWAATFGKAIVIIVNENQRFQRLDNKTIDNIYKDYSDFIAYASKTFLMSNDKLQEQHPIPFTKNEVLANAKMSSATFEKINQEEINKKERQEKEAAETKRKEEEQKQANQQNQNGWNNNAYGGPFGGAQGQANPNMDQLYQNLPKSPFADPRFYPYRTKPKWMPIIKYIFGSLVIVAAIILIIANAYSSSKSFYFNKLDWAQVPEMKDNWWFHTGPGNTNNDWTLVSEYGKTKFNLNGTSGTTALNIVSYFLYAIPAVWVSYVCFKPATNNIEKYRISYWPLFLIVIFYLISIAQVSNYLSEGSLNSLWTKWFENVAWIKKGDDHVGITTAKNTAGTGPYDYKPIINSWWQMMESNYDVKSIVVLNDIAFAFLLATSVFAIFIAIFQPHLDREKVAKANNEYQMAIAASMQGKQYRMDESLFDDNKDVVIRQKTKFGLWIEKQKEKFRFKKNKTKTDAEDSQSKNKEDKKDKNK